MISEKPVNLTTFDFFSFSEPPFRGLVTFIGRFWGTSRTKGDSEPRYSGWTTSSYLCLLQSAGGFHHVEISKGHGQYNRVHDCGPCDCGDEPIGRIRLSLAT